MAKIERNDGFRLATGLCWGSLAFPRPLAESKRRTGNGRGQETVGGEGEGVSSTLLTRLTLLHSRIEMCAIEITCDVAHIPGRNSCRRFRMTHWYNALRGSAGQGRASITEGMGGYQSFAPLWNRHWSSIE